MISSEFSATTLDNSLTQPVIVTEGSDALLTCVAKQLGEHTVLWKYGRDKILTAGSSRITSDKRFGVLHDEGNIKKDHKIDQGQAIIFIRGPHCTLIGVSRAKFQSKRLIKSYKN